MGRVRWNSVFQEGHGHCIFELSSAVIRCVRAVQSVLKGAIVTLNLGHSQQPANWTLGPLNRREFMPSTVKLANYPRLKRSWTVEENLLLSLF